MCGGGSSRRSSTDSSRRSSGGGAAGDSDSSIEPETEGATSEDLCHFSQQVSVANANPELLDNIAIGDMYLVEIQDQRPCIVDLDDQIIGSILDPPADELEQCIESGYSYRAEIVRIEGRSCEAIIQNKCPIDVETRLASLDPDVLSQTSEGDRFDTIVRSGSLCVVDDSDRTVGCLAEAWTGIAIECIESGWEYNVTIENIEGGDCTVHVTSSEPAQ